MIHLFHLYLDTVVISIRVIYFLYALNIYNNNEFKTESSRIRTIDRIFH